MHAVLDVIAGPRAECVIRSSPREARRFESRRRHCGSNFKGPVLLAAQGRAVFWRVPLSDLLAAHPSLAEPKTLSPST